MPDLDPTVDEFSSCLLAPLLPEPEALLDVPELQLLAFEPELIPMKKLVPVKTAKGTPASSPKS